MKLKIKFKIKKYKSDREYMLDKTQLITEKVKELNYDRTLKFCPECNTLERFEDVCCNNCKIENLKLVKLGLKRRAEKLALKASKTNKQRRNV